MRKLTVVVMISLLLCSLSTFAGAYTIQCNVGGWDGPSASFGTGLERSTAIQPNQRIGVVDPVMDLARSQLFVAQDPGWWQIQAVPNYPDILGTLVKFWVTDLGTEGPSDQLWRAVNGWGDELWSGALLAQTTTGADPTADIYFDFGMYPEFILEKVVPEPSSIVVLLSGFTGLAGFALRRRK